MSILGLNVDSARFLYFFRSAVSKLVTCMLAPIQKGNPLKKLEAVPALPSVVAL